jgi:thiamine biosynthesis lipoprotein
MTAVDRRFEAMGCTVRLIVDCTGTTRGDAGSPVHAFERTRAFIQDFDRRLSRFRPDSELSRLNGAAAEEVAVSPLLAALVRAALTAAERTGGLVDPTLGPRLAQLGYARSWPFAPALSLRDALLRAPPRRAASARQPADWRAIEVGASGMVRRPPGVELDSGGIGKGLAADLAARRLRHLPRVLVDCGGDIAVAGTGVGEAPFEIAVRHPLDGSRAFRLVLRGGAVATSGLERRIWRRPDGGVAHHLLDPASGEPAWTGLVSATALGRTTVEAEALAKAALLSGPAGARELLAERGGLVVHDSGQVEPVGAAARMRYRLPAGLARAA